MARAQIVCGNSPGFLWRGAPKRAQAHSRASVAARRTRMPNRSDHDGQSHAAKKQQKERIDLLLVARGLAPSRERAQALLIAGCVRVDGQPVTKAGARVSNDARVEMTGESNPYAGRGGLKLEGAIEDFGVSPREKICLDVGSSTGGFTDCLLQHGAAKVYAVDVSIQQLDWKLRQDARVVKVERNARYLLTEDISESPALIVVDVSFISVAKVIPAIVPVAARGADLLILIKPQFELEKRDVGKGGIVRETGLHQKAIERVVGAAKAAGLEIIGVKPSRLPGAKGNQEFFLHAVKSAQSTP
jgi:23S rRNA (cytidine1920-2'-O)/16S rRNA (cytidine1409-2'-O)-methyltransferase